MKVQSSGNPLTSRFTLNRRRKRDSLILSKDVISSCLQTCRHKLAPSSPIFEASSPALPWFLNYYLSDHTEIWMFGSVSWIDVWFTLLPWESHFTQSVVWNPETADRKTLIKVIMQKTREGSEFWQKRVHSTKHHPKPLLNWFFLCYIADFFLFFFFIQKVLKMAVELSVNPVVGRCCRT